MFSECKITLIFCSAILDFNYSTLNKSADSWCHFKPLRINDVLHQSSPLHKMLIPKIIDDTVFYRVNSYTISQFHTQYEKHIKIKKETCNRRRNSHIVISHDRTSE